MTRTALRHTLSALAAAAFSLALLGQAAAGDRRQTPKLHPSQLQWASAANSTSPVSRPRFVPETYIKNTPIVGR